MRHATCDRCRSDIGANESVGTLILSPSLGMPPVTRPIDLCERCWGTVVRIVDRLPAQCLLEGIGAPPPRCTLPAGHEGHDHRDGNTTWVWELSGGRP